MPHNPTHPAPPIAQPGQQRPLPEIRQPGQSHPQRDADADPLHDDPLTAGDNVLERNDDLMPPL